MKVHDISNHPTAQSSSRARRCCEARRHANTVLTNMEEIKRALFELAGARGPGGGGLERILARQLGQMINDVRQALNGGGVVDDDIPF